MKSWGQKVEYMPFNSLLKISDSGVIVLDKRVFEEMIGVVDRHFQVAALNDFLKRCIDEKMKVTSIWSEITLCTHFMLGGDSSFIYRIGAFTELIILALDIIDDLVDQD